MSPVPGRTDQTGQQATAEEASQSEQTSVKTENGNGSSDVHANTVDSGGVGTNGTGTQKHAESSETASEATPDAVAEPSTGFATDSAVESIAGSAAKSVADPAPATECRPAAGNGHRGEQPAETAAGDSRKEAEDGNSGGDPVGAVSSASEENGRAAGSPPPPQEKEGAGSALPPEGQNGADKPTRNEGENGSEKTSLTGDSSGKGQGHNTHMSVESNGQGENVTTSPSDHQPSDAKNNQSAETENSQSLTDAGKGTSAEATTDPAGLMSEDNLKSGDNHEPLETARDQGAVSAPSPPSPAAEVAVPGATEGADSTESPAEPSAEVSDRAVPAAAGSQETESSRSPPGAEAGPEESQQQPSGSRAGPAEPQQQPQPSGSTAKSGMTEVRSIWVVGSDEHLPGAGGDEVKLGLHQNHSPTAEKLRANPTTLSPIVGGEEAGAAAASWATVHSTVRAIRVFKRGVSKRLRRPPSHDRQQEPPPPRPSRSAERQLSHPAGSSAGAEQRHEPAAGGFLRSLSFRRSASWRGPLRRGDRHAQAGAAAAAPVSPGAAGAAGGDVGDGLDAAMQQTAGPAPLQPHVNRAAFTEACAAYEPPQKPGGPAADQTGRDKKESQLKEELRASYYPLDHPSRHQLWANICQTHGATLGQNEEYESTVRQLEGDYGPARRGQHQTPPFVHSFYMNQYALSEQGAWTAERVLAVLYYNNPTITYAPSLYPVCCLMLHYMDEADTYNALNMMLRNKKQGYLVQTKRDFEISWKILIKLCRKHTKTSLHFLQQEARAGENVEHVLADWLAWLFCFLPFAHAVRLMDCYLMEGEKVLYRGAMALVLLVHKMASHQLGEWAYSFKEFTVQEVMEKFCTNIQLAPEKLLKTMFGIRGFSRDSLTSSYARVKAQIKAGGGRLNFPERRCTRSFSKQQSHPGGLGMPSVMSQDELAEASSTIGVKELLRLWENLPARYALYTPLLIYTSDEHGFSLKTFYQKVATFEPTVLLLRTTEGAVFGAYCSVTWNMRNESLEDGSRQRYFGTGETFLFTLRPRLKVFPWVGKVRQAEDPELAGLSHSEQLFMAADNTMVTIGGGGGGQAIWLDENLSRGKTDACETFANPPLTPSGSFDVACMEAFAFSPA